MICAHDYKPYSGACSQCEYVRCAVCGVIRRQRGCVEHNRGEGHYNFGSYYDGNFDGRVLKAFIHNRELRGAWPKDYKVSGDLVLEFGAGVGQYAPFWMQNGFEYAAVEISEYGREYIECTFCCRAYKTYDDFSGGRFGLRPDVVFSAHFLEHVQHPEAMFTLMANAALRHFILLVPLGTDELNQDHWTYFFPETLAHWAKGCDLKVVDIVRKSYSKTSDYLFLFADKKGSA